MHGFSLSRLLTLLTSPLASYPAAPRADDAPSSSPRRGRTAAAASTRRSAAAALDRSRASSANPRAATPSALAYAPKPRCTTEEDAESPSSPSSLPGFDAAGCRRPALHRLRRVSPRRLARSASSCACRTASRTRCRARCRTRALRHGREFVFAGRPEFGGEVSNARSGCSPGLSSRRRASVSTAASVRLSRE